VRLDPSDYDRLAETLGDAPETVIPLHQIVRRLATVYLVGQPDDFAAVIIQAIDDPSEPSGFGSDPAAFWSLLQAMSGWWCVNVPAAVAPALGDLIAARTGRPARLYGDRHFILTTPAPVVPHPAVRLLSTDDLALVAAAPASVRPVGWGGLEAALRDGVAAGGIVDGHLVAIAFTSARTARHADIGVTTLEEWRGRGLATAAASLVARQIQVSGQTPVWSTGEENHASLRIAHKLGFTEVTRRAYVIPQRP
jgi:hypothetical protein